MKEVTHKEILKACLEGEAGDLETPHEQIEYFNSVIAFTQTMQRQDFTVEDVEWDNIVHFMLSRLG